MADADKIRFGIFPKLLTAMALTAIIPLGVIWYVNLQSTSERIAQSVDVQLDRAAEDLQVYVDTWVDMNLRMLRENAALPGIRSMQPARQNPILKLMADEYDWNYLAFTVAPNGQNIGRSDGKAPKFYGDRAYVQQVLRGEPRGQQVLIGKTSGKPAFVLAVPIRGADRAVRGVLAIAMTIADISKRVARARIGRSGQAFLVDERGKVIAHQNPLFTSQRKDLSDNPAVRASEKQGDTHLTYTAADGRKMVAAVRKTRYGWTLVVEEPQAEAFAAVREANRNALILLGVTLAAVVLVALALARRLSVPLQRLTAIAEGISRGQLGEKIAYVGRLDEIGALARAIDRLGTSVRLALQRIARYRREAGTRVPTA